MAKLTFSTILISYNQRRTILDAAHSVLDALGSRGELVCVDDGSTDGTDSLLDELATQHANMRVIRHPHSGRPASARNVGLGAAQGDWISFLDGDDLYDVRRFDRLAAAIAEPSFDSDFAFHDHRVFVDGTVPTAGLPRISPELDRDLAVTVADGHPASPDAQSWRLDGDRLAVFLLAQRFVLQTSSFAVRRRLLRERGLVFDADRVFGEDNPFMLACALGSRVTYVRDTLTFYRKHHGSLTAAMNPAGHREQVRSLHEQVALVETHARHALTATSRSAMQAMLYEATLHHGYLLEHSGRATDAAVCYLRTAASFRRPWAVALAAKALVRKPKLVVQPLLAADNRTK